MSQRASNSLKTSFIYSIGLISGAVSFDQQIESSRNGSLSISLLGYSTAFLITALVCLLLNVIHIKISRDQDCTATPAYPGVIAGHLLVLSLGYIFLRFADFAFGGAIEWLAILVGLITAAGCLLAGRIWGFINPQPSVVSYEEISGEFYQDSTKVEEVGGFRAWYHTGRYVELQRKVLSIYKSGDVIYDFGCGGAEWNSTAVPVVGIDVNRALLEFGMKKNQLSQIVVKELDQTGLPEASADIAIMSEVMEHLAAPVSVLNEIRRCLKPSGSLVLTVPWDTPFSIFFWLFNVQCFYRGYILGESYYRQRCGHINHFSAQRLRKLLEEAGFQVRELYRFRGFLLYAICSR